MRKRQIIMYLVAGALLITALGVGIYHWIVTMDILFSLLQVHFTMRREKIGINYNTVYNRVYSLGWSVEKAITTPSKGKGANQESYK